MRYILLVVFLLLSAPHTFAASLYMDPNSATLNRGDAITVAVRLDTDEASGECINAIDGVITYDETITPVDISVGKSILPMWVEAPVIHKENHTITFAGGIPNGYCGRVQGDPNLTNTIVELVFRAPGLQVGGGEARKNAKITFTDATAAYLNDGQGTEATLQTFGTEFTLNDTVGNEIKDPWTTTVGEDTISPEPFSVALGREDKTAEGKYFIEFNTTDKQTGLDHYEVIEETTADSNLFRFGAVNSPWVEARSPYILKDQSLSRVIRVKAIDKAGNEYIATMIPDEALRTTQLNWMMVGVVVLAFVVMLGLGTAVWFLWRRRKNRQSRNAGAEEESVTTIEHVS